MPGASSSPAVWRSWIEPANETLFFRKNDPDDPRLGEVVHRWAGDTFRLGQPVLLGFPCDEGVRRNGGRIGAAKAPDAIRAQFYRLTTWHGPVHVDLAQLQLTDVGNLRVDGDLETAQQRLGVIIGHLLRAGAVPIILGGGHETAYGHYLGYVEAQLDCAIVNIDAHLDVRPYTHGSHSGSPFRQAMEHPTRPLKPGCYTVLGAQPQSVSCAHEEYVRKHGGRIYWCIDSAPPVIACFADELRGRHDAEQRLLLTIDADAFCQADAPGVSAPNPMGLSGALWPAIAHHAGLSPCVRSLDLVETNPLFDVDGHTARWAAVGIRQFLVGLAQREARAKE